MIGKFFDGFLGVTEQNFVDCQSESSKELVGRPLVGNLHLLDHVEALIELRSRTKGGKESSHSDSGHYENKNKIFHCPTSSGASERSRARERSEQCGASE